MKKVVYADCAATTPVADAVLNAMLPWYREGFGNPSSLHRMGRAAAYAVCLARGQVAKAIGAPEDQVFFTSGATEANNWVIKNHVLHEIHCKKKNCMKIVSTTIEHHSVLNPLDLLRQLPGFHRVLVPVGTDGIVDPAAIRAEILAPPGATLVSVMYANNEIGTIQPIWEIGAICRELGVLFHVDAVQVGGKLPIDAVRDNIDMLSLSGHKLGGPKGVGALYLSERASGIGAYLHGGGQEQDMRSGTENVPAIVGLGMALELADINMENRVGLVTAMRDTMINGILVIPGAQLNGHRRRRLPGSANISFAGVDSDALLTVLDLEEGVMASSGSACNASSVEQSHVLKAIGVPETHGSIRLTIDENNTPEDIRHICGAVLRSVEKLRRR